MTANDDVLVVIQEHKRRNNGKEEQEMMMTNIRSSFDPRFSSVMTIESEKVIIEVLVFDCE
jgi:hypothetical protein